MRKYVVCYAVYDFNDDDTCYGCGDLYEWSEATGLTISNLNTKFKHSMQKGKYSRLCEKKIKAYRYVFDYGEVC